MVVESGYILYRSSPLREPRRPLRSLVVGSVAGVSGLMVDNGHWFTTAVLGALAVDLWLVLRYCLRLSQANTRMLFEAAELKRSALLLRALLVFVISIIFLVFSINKIHWLHGQKPLDLSVYFLGVMLCWLQLQLAFAIYYAKIFFRSNPLDLPSPTGLTPSRDDDEGPQELIFPGADEPLFSDFLYVAATVALTFATSDVSVESSRLRRTILIQAMMSFVFYTMIFSVVTNQLINNY